MKTRANIEILVDRFPNNMALDCVKARIIDDRKLIRIGLIRIDLRSLSVVDSTELSRNSKGMVFGIDLLGCVQNENGSE